MKIRELYLTTIVGVLTMFVTSAAAQSFQNDNENNGLSENKETKLHEQNIEMDAPVKYVDTGNPDYDDLAYKRDMIKYLRHAEGFPEYEDKGDDYESALQFNQALKVWYQRHPEYLSILDLKTYKELKKYDVSCYPDPPEYSKSESERAYRDAFRQWMAHHPDVPKLQGDDMASKEKFEREKAAFYKKYYKK